MSRNLTSELCGISEVGGGGGGGGVEHAQHMAVFVLMPAGGCDAV